MRRLTALLGSLVTISGCTGGDDAGRLELGLSYDAAAHRIDVTVSRELASGETLHTRVRRGAVGKLDCASAAAKLERIDDLRVAGPLPTFAGKVVDASAFLSPYDPSWLSGPEPTPDMLARIAEGTTIVDICLMNGPRVVLQAELDARHARDHRGVDGKADGEEGRLASTVAYAERCVEDLGEIPFFEPIGNGDYGTFNCLDAVPIATTVTAADGAVSRPSGTVQQCDNPEYIYSLCEGNAVAGRSNGPRVARRENDQGTSWVLLCRKAQPTEGQYNDIAMIGHNPFTGKTCFFQNALYSRTDGLHVPHPGDKVASTQSSAISETLWEGIHGGLGNGIQCANCHDGDPFIHTPWIDQARGPDGTQVVPRLGEHPNFALGFNDAPYSIVNTAGQGWTMPKQVTSTEAAACTRCHRIGSGQWVGSYLTRLNGSDPSWTAITTETFRKFEHVAWMPPDVDGVDAASFPTSEYGRAMQFLIDCGREGRCQLAPLPSSPIADDGQLPGIELPPPALAKGALAVLGADVEDASCPGGRCETRRCAECHSVSRSGLRRWLGQTQAAWQQCGLSADPETMTAAQARTSVDCLRVDPRDPTSPFEAAKLGVLATGVQYGPFQRLFRRAFGDGWLVEYARFKARVGMPKGNHPSLSQKEFAILSTWFLAGLAGLDEQLREAPPPATCTPALDTAALAAHAEEMKFEGWGAVNREAGMRMYGCTGDDAAGCFSTAPDRSSAWGNGAGTVRELEVLDFRTSYWTRSSADGRFVGNGGGPSGATITDLQGGRNIAVHASYDPGFFPDNSGFIFQGSQGGAGICRQSLLEQDGDIDFNEPECIKAAGINLYQHVARGIGGSGDYFIINSQFTSDSGGGTSDPAAGFNASSTMKLTPMVFDGSHYVAQAQVIVDSPYEGDSVLSPSMRLVASRLAGPNGQALGYVVRKVETSRFGDAYRVSIDHAVATLCGPGAKPSFSFDERFMVTHHYENGGANLVLIDLRDGSQHVVTRMPAGLKALYPHFRSDGWIYFLVKGGDHEIVAATDAAIRLAAQRP